MVDYKKANQWMVRQRKLLAEYVAAEASNGFLETNQKNVRAYVDGSGPAGAALGGLLYLATYQIHLTGDAAAAIAKVRGELGME